MIRKQTDETRITANSTYNRRYSLYT